MSEKSVKEQLQTELSNLESLVDEVKLQMHLGAKEAQDKIKPYLAELEEELSQAKEKWDQFENNSVNPYNQCNKLLRKQKNTSHLNRLNSILACIRLIELN